MRGSGFQPRRSLTMLIIIINVVVFVLELSLQKFANFDLNNYFALSPDLLKRGWIWQLLTFQVLHGGWLHLLFNCWAIYMFGRDVEDSLGVGRFLTLYLGSGLVGGLAQCIFGWIWPEADYLILPECAAIVFGWDLLSAVSAVGPWWSRSEHRLPLLRP